MSRAVAGQSQLRRDCLHIGLLINPIAGVGGAAALVGSDGAEVQQEALRRGSVPRGLDRAVRFLRACMAPGLRPASAALRWSTWADPMGAAAFERTAAHTDQLDWQVLGSAKTLTEPADTAAAVRGLLDTGVDLLVFVGGDGTARDVFDVVADRALVLGVPAGVKMHSGVFATTPEAAAAVVRGLAAGAIVADRLAEVRDLDEARRRAGELRTVCYGEMRIPEAGGYLQHTKEGGRENEALAVEEVVAQVLEHASGQLVLGPGSTCARIKAALQMEPTLLGVDVWQDGAQIGTNVSAPWLARHAPEPDALIVSFIRAQGFLFGRGNQQLASDWLARLPPDRLQVVGTRSKLASLEGQPLLVDTDTPELNAQLCGLVSVIVGYQDTVLYRVASHGDAPADASA